MQNKSAHFCSRHEYDISTAGLATSLGRSHVMDFTIALMKNNIGIILRDSERVAVNYWVFVQVFMKFLWAGISVVVVILAVGFFVIGINQVISILKLGYGIS